jgi:hypothetical protein
MRFHNLKAYLPELEAKLGKTSVYALEYSAHLEDAEANHIPLFSETEKVKMKTQMQTADLDLQKAKLTILVKETIPEREDLIYEYAALDDDLRNDKDFLGANHEERKSLLKDAKLQEQREQQNPLDLSDVDIFDEVTRNEHIKDMQTAEGRNAIEDKLEMFEQQFEVADVQGQLYQKIFGVSKHMEQTGNSMKDEYLRDRAKWMRINENLAREKIENVKEDPRRLWQREALEEASTAYDMHEVSTSGGEQEELQVINNLDDKSNEEKIKKARYPQFILLVGEDGKDELHPHQRILKKQTREVARVLNMLIRAMGFDLHLNSSAQSAYVNSPIVKREMARAVVESYFAKYLDVGGANNSDHFIEDVANAA